MTDLILGALAPPLTEQMPGVPGMEVLETLNRSIINLRVAQLLTPSEADKACNRLVRMINRAEQQARTP